MSNDDNKYSKGVGEGYDYLRSNIGSDFCAQCGACVASCPFHSLKIEDGMPKLDGSCESCGLCFTQCPQFSLGREEAKDVFGEDYDLEGVGSYKNAYSVKSDIDELKGFQDGGATISILYSVLKKGFVDAVVVVGDAEEKKWKPEPYVVDEAEDLSQYTGTIYSPSRMLQGVREAVEELNIDRIAVVGTPCQVKSIRRMDTGEKPLKKLSSHIKLVIGLFCMESFPYDEIVRFTEEEMGLCLENVSKFDINKGDFVAYCDGEKKGEIPVKELSESMCEACKVCLDFSSELADISIGSVGAPGNHNAVLVRTDKGKKAFKIASDNLLKENLDDVNPGIGLIEKLSNKKKDERVENIKSLRDKEKDIPPKVLKCPKCGDSVNEVYSDAYRCESCDEYYSFDQLLEF